MAVIHAKNSLLQREYLVRLLKLPFSVILYGLIDVATNFAFEKLDWKEFSHGTGREIKPCFECEAIRGAALATAGSYIILKNKDHSIWYNRRPYRQLVPTTLFFMSLFSFHRATQISNKENSS